MAKNIRNPKVLQGKSRICTVVENGDTDHLRVTSPSGSTYNVVILRDGRAVCDCDWGKYRPAFDPSCGCSHALAAHNYRAGRAGRRVYAWLPNDPAIERSHRPSRSIGDGVTITTRTIASI